MILPDSKLFSVSAGIATEKLFQDKNRSGPKFNFLEQQFWMYFYGSIVNWTAHSLYDSDHDLMSVAFSLLGKKKFHKFMDVSVSVSCVLMSARLEGQHGFVIASCAFVALRWRDGRGFHFEAFGQCRQGVLLFIGKHLLCHHMRLRLPRPLRDQWIHRPVTDTPLHRHILLRGPWQGKAKT